MLHLWLSSNWFKLWTKTITIRTVCTIRIHQKILYYQIRIINLWNTKKQPNSFLCPIVSFGIKTPHSVRLCSDISGSSKLSEWYDPFFIIFLFPKKNGTITFCTDLRYLNWTWQVRHPGPNSWWSEIGMSQKWEQRDIQKANCKRRQIFQ